jgi:chromosome segregation ATPase
MFKSVGLNIDNPETFFVRQGRITKIVNFKASDLKEMLEEAAGISYYKEVSAGCIKVMDRKGREHRNQESRMIENLAPKIAMLERQKKIEEEYKSLNQKLEQVKKLNQ